MNLSEIKPERDQLIDDMERMLNKLKSGELTATTVIVVIRDRVNEGITTGIAGENLPVSHIMGILSYASARYYEGR